MSARPYDKVALTVVRGLVWAALLGLAITGVLCYTALQFEGDSSTIAIIAIVGNLSAGALGGLGAVLATTGKTGEPVPVEVTNDASQAVPVQDSPDVGTTDVTVHPDSPESSDL